MGDGAGPASTPKPLVWTPELAQAVAEHGVMPGLPDLQQQYVRYRGQTEAIEASSGWQLSESLAALTTLAPSDRDAAGALERLNARSATAPAQVSLTIASAPAEFCLPVKNDRQFKPHFQVQVSVKHRGALHLPLRMKAYIVVEDDKQSITEWLPDELDLPGGKSDRLSVSRRQLTELKGAIVVSNVFRVAGDDHANPSVASERSPSGDADAQRGITDGTGAYSFPTKAGKGTEGTRVLKHNDSIRSQDNDPEMAKAIDLSTLSARAGQDPDSKGAATNTIMAQYEFKALEFAHPTRMNRVYMVFACLILGQDLLYTVFQAPCISICRAEQRTKALDKLGMPATAYDDVARGGGMRSGKKSAAAGAAAAAAAAATAAAAAAASSSAGARQAGASSRGKSAGVGVREPSLREAWEGATNSDSGRWNSSNRASASEAPSHSHHVRCSTPGTRSSNPGTFPPESSQQYQPADPQQYGLPPPGNYAADSAISLGKVDSLQGLLKDLSLPLNSFTPDDPIYRFLQDARRAASSSQGGIASGGVSGQGGLPGGGPPGEGDDLMTDQQADEELRAHVIGGIQQYQATQAGMDFTSDTEYDNIQAFLRSLDSNPAGLPAVGSLPTFEAQIADLAPDLAGTQLGGGALPGGLLGGAQGYQPGQYGAAPTAADLLYSSGMTGSGQGEGYDQQLQQQLLQQQAYNSSQALQPPQQQFQQPPWAGASQGSQPRSWSGLLGEDGPAQSDRLHAQHHDAPDSSGAGPAGGARRYRAAGGTTGHTGEPARNGAPAQGGDWAAPLGAGVTATSGQGGAAGGDDGDAGQALVTQQQAYDWIIGEYNATGLQRRLAVQDLRALLSLAGFPEMAGLDPSIRVGMRQFQEFMHTFQASLAMLKSMSALWNIQDPCIVSGFDMDRRAAEAELANEPAGTFICRFSMNQPGCLVLSCRVAPGSQPGAAGDLLHVTISSEEMRTTRVDQLILSVPQASHVLDVYSNRRVDKRRLLASGYLRFQRVSERAGAAAPCESGPQSTSQSLGHS